MPSSTVSIPRFCQHKASGQAVVRLNGKDHYLGRFGSPDAEQAYKRLIAIWISNGERLPEENSQLSVNEVILQYWAHCDRHYRKPDGRPTSELDLTEAERAEVRKWRSDHAWHPHQQRHNAATHLRREFGIEIARGCCTTVRQQ